MLDPTLLRLGRQGSMTYVPPSRSHSAMPWDAKDSMTYDPIPPHDVYGLYYGRGRFRPGMLIYGRGRFHPGILIYGRGRFRPGILI